MTRPQLYWTVQYQHRRISLMRVTRVTDLRIYGSSEGISTHCPPSAIFGVYDTEEAAHSAMRKVLRLMVDANARITALTHEIEQLEQSTQRDVTHALERLRQCK